jgi:hypothetical protein
VEPVGHRWREIRGYGSCRGRAHAAEGTIGREFTGTNGFVGPDKTHWILLYTGGWCAVAVCLILFDRRLWLSSHGRAPARVAVAPAGQPTAST